MDFSGSAILVRQRALAGISHIGNSIGRSSTTGCALGLRSCWSWTWTTQHDTTNGEKGMKQVKQVHPISSITWSPWQLKGSNSARDGHQNIGWSHEPMLGHCWIPNGIPNVLRLKSRFRNLHFLNYHELSLVIKQVGVQQSTIPRATTICVTWQQTACLATLLSSRPVSQTQHLFPMATQLGPPDGHQIVATSGTGGAKLPPKKKSTVATGSGE